MKFYPAAQIRNLTVLGHSGSGKTSVVEAMLYNSKAIERMGRVPDGNTVTDFDQEEIRRGASINTSYAAVEWKNCKINLIDCPGDFDFIADQRLGMRAGDIAFVVLGAKDGITVGARKALSLAEKAQMPAALLINRCDEPNANFEKTLEAFRDEYGAKVVPLALPIMKGETMIGVVDVLSNKASEFGKCGELTPTDVPADMQDAATTYHEGLMEQIAESDEALMEKFFEGEAFSPEEIASGIQSAILTHSLIPVFPSAATADLGISFLMDRIVEYFPSPDKKAPAKAQSANGEELELPCDPNGPVAAFVFKTIVDPFVGRISLFRVMSGTFTLKNPPYNPREEKDERVNALYVLRGKKQIEVEKLEAGDIGAVTKLVSTVTNDTLTSRDNPVIIAPVAIPEPVLTRAVIPVKRGEEDKIMLGMNKLADEDVAFTIKNDPETHQLLLSGQGEIQLDALLNKLKGKFGAEAKLEEPRVAYRETIRKKVKVQGRHKKQSGGHGQYGDVWIVFEPGEKEEMEFAEEVFGGAVPKNYFPAVEKGLQEAVTEGVLAGYPVVNLKATLVDGSYHEVDSNEMSFKLAAHLAYRAGLPQADPVLLEPISTLRVHIPDENLGDIMGDISKRRGRILGMGADAEERGFQVVEAEAPASELSKYATDLRSMTQGRGWFTMAFARYEQAPNEVSEKVIAAAQAAKEEA